MYQIRSIITILNSSHSLLTRENYFNATLVKMFRNLSDVDVIVVENEDRLARFGYSYLKEFAASFNVTIEAVEKVGKLQPNEEMVNDLVSIVTCFSARLYGARGGRKLKQTIVQTLEILEQERGESVENNAESDSYRPDK